MLATVLSKCSDVSNEVLSHPDFIKVANKFIDVVQMIPEENKMKKSDLRQIIREEIKNVIQEKYGRDNSDLIRLHKSKDQKEYDLIMKDLRKSSGWSQLDAEYMLKKYRNDIKYKGPKFYPGDPKTKPTVKPKKVTWNDRSYQKWIKDMASGGGANHSYDMAQNAKQEPGLLDFVKRKKTNGESPLERIQWDIENYA